jgi:branched-chain amino acid transport system substrate-binding protein
MLNFSNVKIPGLKSHFVVALLLWAISVLGHGQDRTPVLVGVDGEFGLENSISAQAVELGLRIAIAEINAAGGVLGGRPIDIVTKDHRSMPARGIRNIKEFAEMPDLVAVFGGRFSPVVIEQLPILKETKLLFMATWSSADPIIDNGMHPNYIFRVSLRDSLAMPKMLDHARQRGLNKVGLLLTNTSWGRSNRAAADKYEASGKPLKIVQTAWYNWQDRSLIDKYHSLLNSGAQAIVLVAIDDEAAVLVREMASLPTEKRIPVISHWGITGGEFVKLAGPALREVDFSVIQTFSFFNADRKPLERFMRAAAPFGVTKIEDIRAPVGVAHAYDAMHILAKAINLARSTERSAVRDALENIREHRGLIKHYKPPFSKDSHEALGPNELLIARYRADGVLIPVENNK